MASNAGSSPQKVNPVLLIALGVLVIYAAYYLMTGNQKKPSEDASTANNVTSSQNVSTDQNVNNNNNTATPNTNVSNNNSNITPTQPKKKEPVNEEVKETKEVKNAKGLGKNPFLTPSIYLSLTGNSSSSSSDPGKLNQQNTIVPPLDSDKNKEAINTPKEPAIRLGGVFIKRNDKVALIYYLGKGYIQRENELIKSSGFRLKHINDKSVVIENENGVEDVLRLEEKAIKTKGGEGN